MKLILTYQPHKSQDVFRSLPSLYWLVFRAEIQYPRNPHHTPSDSGSYTETILSEAKAFLKLRLSIYTRVDSRLTYISMFLIMDTQFPTSYICNGQHPHMPQNWQKDFQMPPFARILYQAPYFLSWYKKIQLRDSCCSSTPPVPMFHTWPYWNLDIFAFLIQIVSYKTIAHNSLFISAFHVTPLLSNGKKQINHQ